MFIFLQVEQYIPGSHFWDRLVKYSKSPIPVIQGILDQYKGIEGDYVEYLTSENLQIIEAVIQEENLSKPNIASYILSTHDVEINLKKFQNHFVHVGYEYAQCEDDCTVYSSIFHEILFANNQELALWKNFLNESLLLPSMESSIDYVNLHSKLFLDGKGVENNELLNIYKVWKYEKNYEI